MTNTQHPHAPTVPQVNQTVPFVDLKAQHEPLKQALIDVFVQRIENADFVLGEDVSTFEQEFASYCGTKYAVGVDSGLSALELLLKAYGIGPGDEVIVPTNSFVATAAAVTLVGAQPVLVDIEQGTHNVDAAMAERAVHSRTRAIIPVHLYGTPANLDGILALANRYNLIVIADACQAHGARYHGRPVGQLGHGAAFSFYPTKNLGACGDGGIAVTDDMQVAAQLRALRNCGQTRKNVHELMPYNHRLDTLQASILRLKLKHLDEWNAARQRNARLYNEYLADSGVETPAMMSDATQVWHLYVIRTDRRDELKDYLTHSGIATAIHYPVPIHLQPFYAPLGYSRGDLPVAERYSDQILSLPMYPELRPDQIEYVAQTIRDFFR